MVLRMLVKEIIGLPFSFLPIINIKFLLSIIYRCVTVPPYINITILLWANKYFARVARVIRKRPTGIKGKAPYTPDPQQRPQQQKDRKIGFEERLFSWFYALILFLKKDLK